MSLTRGLHFFAVLVCVVPANCLNEAENQLSRLYPPSNLLHPTSSSNGSLTPNDVSKDNTLTIKCDGAQYGVKLNIADCKDAKSYISSGSEQFPWVGRHTRWHKPRFALPYRYMGGKNERVVLTHNDIFLKLNRQGTVLHSDRSGRRLLARLCKSLRSPECCQCSYFKM